jgi:hypothetical protein
MRYMAGVVLGLVLLAAVGPAAARSYVTGVIVAQLEIFPEENGTRPIYVVPAERVVEPIAVSSESGSWLEIVVDDRYYWVRREDVLVSRDRAGGAPMKAAAGQGARLGFGGR